MARTTVGLEITEESVRAVEVTQGRAPQLVSYGEVPLPAEAARDSEVIDQGAVAVALRQLWTGARLKGKRVVLGVASRRILVREYTTQAMRPDLLREALPYQVQDLLPVPASQAVLDFYPLGQEGNRVSGLLVAAVSETIEQIVSTLDRVKLRLAAVDLGAFGLARATARLAGTDEAVATVYVGDHTTQVVVARAGRPLFVRLLPVDMPTAAVRRRSAPVEEPLLEAPVPAPEGLYSAIATTRTRGAVRTAGPLSVVNDLAARVRSTLSFYRGRPNAIPISRVFATGPGVGVEGVVAAFAAALDVPVTIVSATDVIAGVVPPQGEIALSMVSTIGIALGGDR